MPVYPVNETRVASAVLALGDVVRPNNLNNDTTSLRGTPAEPGWAARLATTMLARNWNVPQARGMPASPEGGGEQAEAHLVGGARPDHVSRWEFAQLGQFLSKGGVVGTGDPRSVSQVDVDGGGHRLEPLMVEVEIRNVEQGLGVCGVGVQFHLMERPSRCMCPNATYTVMER